MTHMPEACKYERVEASLTMAFAVCRDHGGAQAAGGIISVPESVGPMKVIKTALGVLEQNLAGLLVLHPQVKAVAEAEYGGEELSDRAKNRVLTLLAHAYLQRTVAEAGWERPEGVDFHVVGPDD